MKKVLSVIACGALAACSCNESQWEEVNGVVFEEAVYDEQAPLNEMPAAQPAMVPVYAAQPMPEPAVVQPKPVYINAPRPVYDCPCAEVQPQPCGQPSCYQPQPCGCRQMPAPEPKITTTRKIITTTTTTEEPCGKPVCEPVVTTHEEIIPATVSYSGYTYAAPAEPVVQNAPASQGDYVEVTVEKNPYRSEMVGMSSASGKVDAAAAAKYSPEAYIVVATRAANRMLQDTSAIYDTGRTKTVYIKDTKLLSSDLPYGSHRLKGTLKDIISGSNTYEVVNNANNADFVIDSSADWYVVSNAAPALQYKLEMFDRSGKKVNEWVEIIRQVQD